MPIANTHYYESLGQGTPIIFIHPPHMGHVVFKYQKELSEHFKVIFYDIRGHGKSGLPGNEPITIPLLAEDLKKLLDEIGVESVIVCGYSNGGSIALEFALRYPERTRAIVLSGGFSEVNTFILRRQFKLGITITRLKLKSLLSALLAKSHKITKEDEQELYDYGMKTNINVTHEFYKNGLTYNCTARLHELKMPMYLINGARSHHMHPYMQLFKQEIPHAKPIFVHKALHQIPTKFYRDLNQIIVTELK